MFIRNTKPYLVKRMRSFGNFEELRSKVRKKRKEKKRKAENLHEDFAFCDRHDRATPSSSNARQNNGISNRNLASRSQYVSECTVSANCGNSERFLCFAIHAAVHPLMLIQPLAE